VVGVLRKLVSFSFLLQTEAETAKQFCEKVLSSESEYQVCITNAALKENSDWISNILLVTE